MFYVSRINHELDGIKYGITDTKDGVEEFYSKAQIFQFSKSIDIDGVDIADNLICIVKPVKETIRLFKQGKVHLAISTMTINNDSFGLRFKSKPTGGEMNFVNHQVLNVSRSGVNSFSYDLGYSKSYRSGLTLDDILTVFEQFSDWILENCDLGRL